MKKIFNVFMKISCSAMGFVILSIATTATNSISWLTMYEYKLPKKLLPKDE